MKKLLILILALVMCLSVLTSCDQIKGFIDGIFGEDQPEVEYHIDRARSYLNNMYKNENATTAKDYEVVGNVKVAGVDYAVTWTVDTDKVTITGPVTKEDGSVVYMVNVDEESEAEVPYVLTATITAGNGDTATVSFNRVVPEKNLFVSVGNPEEGVAYKFFMIQVSEGNKILYADGTTQSNQDKYLNTTQVGTDAPDFFVEKVGEGFKFYYVKDGTNMYIKAYLTTTDHVKYSKCLMYTSNAAEGTVWTYHADTNSWHTDLVQDTLEGDKTVNYVIGTYSSYLTFSISEASYITPENTGVSQFPGGLLPKAVAETDNSTPEEKVAAELAEIKVPSNVKLDGVLDLPLTGSRYPEVTMTWTSNSEYAVVGEDGKITVTVPAEPTTIKLSVTVAFGEVSETKEFEVELSREATPIADIIALAKTLEDKGATTTDKYIVAGVVVEVKNTTYGNLYIQDAAGNRLYVYGLYDQNDVRYDKMENAPQVGDYVVLLSVVGHYNEPQLKNATVLSCVSATSIPEANEIAKTLEDKGPTTEEKYLLSGKVVEVANTTYGNLYIQDEAGNKMYVYGLYDEAGNRYDKMPVQPKVGDTITVLSVIGHYNNPQLKNAVVVGYTAGTTEEPPVENDDPTPDTELTISEAVALGASKEHNTYTEGKYYVVGTVKEVQNATYGNILIEDANGNTILVYGTYSADGKVRYDAMETRPVVGDTVKVYGVVGQFNGTAQLKNAWIIETTVNHTHDYKNVTVEATCTTAGSVTPTCACGVVDEENVKVLPALHAVSGVCPKCDLVIVNVSDLEVGTTTDAELVEGTGISASAGLTIEANGKSIDGFKFTNRLKLGGSMKVSDGVVAAGIKIVVDGPSTITVYAISGKSTEVRALRLCTLTDGALVDVMVDENVGDPIVKCVFTVDAAGTYYLGSKSSGINLYYVSVATEKEVVAGEQTTAKVAIADYADANSWEDAKQYTTLNVDENVTVTVSGTASGNYGVNTGKYYVNGENWRIYQSETPSIVVTAAEGKTIVSVKITYEVSKTGVLTHGETQITSGTVVEVGANSVTFSVGNTGTATNGQVRITEIEVIYE